MAVHTGSMKDSKKIPPLAWIIVAIVVVLGAIALFGPNRTLTTPSGGKVAAEAPYASAGTTTAPSPSTPPAR